MLHAALKNAEIKKLKLRVTGYLMGKCIYMPTNRTSN